MSDSSERTAQSAGVKSNKIHRAQLYHFQELWSIRPTFESFRPIQFIPLILFSYTSFRFENDFAYAIAVESQLWHLTRCLMENNNKTSLLKTPVERYSLSCESS